MKPRFVPAASDELQEATRWYLEQGGTALAKRFQEAARSGVGSIGAMPMAGRPTEGGCRLWAMRRFPYTLVYRLRGQGIEVIAVAHHRREPGYWVVRT